MPAHDLPEMAALERIIDQHATCLTVQETCSVDAGGRRFPVYALALGNEDRAVPAAGFFGGIHGLERIGTRILLAFMQSLLARLRWDRMLQRQLESIRLVFMPLINPAGMFCGTRCNPRGVDLMRNAPVESYENVPFLLGGHRHSRHLPWFRGTAGEPMEKENQAVCRVVQEELLSRRFSVALDCHSGFGARDRIWFPYAHKTAPILHLPEMFAIQELFSRAYPHHPYLFEPQCAQYLTHGDLWDHLYLQAVDSGRVFLPLTLEMGSWIWIRKNPLQLFSRAGIFNPTPVHRLHRVLRRHLLWLEFLVQAACAYEQWLPAGAARDEHWRRACARWYGGRAP